MTAKSDWHYVVYMAIGLLSHGHSTFRASIQLLLEYICDFLSRVLTSTSLNSSAAIANSCRLLFFVQ